MNNQTSAFDLTLQAPPGKHSRLTRAVQTTNEADFQDVSPLPTTVGGEVSFELPAQSLYTLQFTY